MSRDDASLLDIVNAGKRIQNYVAGQDKESVEANSQARAAVLYEFLVMGEAVKRLSSRVPCQPCRRSLEALKAEIDEEAWSSLYSTKSRPFPRPESKRIAVKVINHYGDEVLKVIGV